MNSYPPPEANWDPIQQAREKPNDIELRPENYGKHKTQLSTRHKPWISALTNFPGPSAHCAAPSASPRPNL